MNLCNMDVTMYENAKISKNCLLNVPRYFCLNKVKSFDVKCMYAAKGTEYIAKYSAVFMKGRRTAGLNAVVKASPRVEVIFEKFLAASLPLLLFLWCFLTAP